MSKSEWLQPVPASVVFDLLQYKIAEVQRGDVEHLEYRFCVTSYLYDLQSKMGTKKNADYARIWGYSESWISRNIDRIRADAIEQSGFYNEGDIQPNGSARPAQDSVKVEARRRQENNAIGSRTARFKQGAGKVEARPPQDSGKTYLSDSLDLQTTEEQGVSVHRAREAIPFNVFWEAYDKRRDRKKCEIRWNRIPAKLKPAIIEHVRVYVTFTPDPQYRKNPLTYLNGECWNDEHRYGEPRQGIPESDPGGEGGAGSPVEADAGEGGAQGVSVARAHTGSNGSVRGSPGKSDRRTASDRRSDYGYSHASDRVDRALSDLTRSSRPD